MSRRRATSSTSCPNSTPRLADANRLIAEGLIGGCQRRASCLRIRIDRAESRARIAGQAGQLAALSAPGRVRRSVGAALWRRGCRGAHRPADLLIDRLDHLGLRTRAEPADLRGHACPRRPSPTGCRRGRCASAVCSIRCGSTCRSVTRPSSRRQNPGSGRRVRRRSGGGAADPRQDLGEPVGSGSW